MARSKTGLRGVGKRSGEVPAEPVGQYFLVEVGHPSLSSSQRKLGSVSVARNGGDPSFRWDDGYGSLRQRAEDSAILPHDPLHHLHLLPELRIVRGEPDPVPASRSDTAGPPAARATWRELPWAGTRQQNCQSW